MLFPAVTIDGTPFIDGGILNHLNAAAAPPADVLVAVSCLPVGAPPGGDRSAATIAADAELERLRGTTRLLTVEPDFSSLATPVRMLDPETAGRALHLGRHQAEREAAALRAAWAPSGPQPHRG